MKPCHRSPDPCEKIHITVPISLKAALYRWHDDNPGQSMSGVVQSLLGAFLTQHGYIKEITE